MLNTKTPILFIPGLFGCMSSEIIAHTGAWQFGFAKSMYKPFVDLLETQGIDTAKRLFTLFYDWQRTTAYNTEYFLLPMLKKIKKLTGSDSVYIIAHGTGGYLARYCLHTPHLPLTIQKLFLIGTPNAGFTTTFSYLTGGELHIACGDVLDFIPLYLRMHLHKNIPTNTSPLNYLNKHFPALYEMLPSKLYGDYLFYTYESKSYPVPYETLLTPNTFLDRLNTAHSIPSDTTIELIAGDGFDTIHQFEIAPVCSDQTWVSGKVLDCIYTPEGDGLSTVASVFAIDGTQHLVKSHYETLLIDAAPIYIPGLRY